MSSTAEQTESFASPRAQSGRLCYKDGNLRYLKKIGDREVTLCPLPSNTLYKFLKTDPARSLENYTLNFNADKGKEGSGEKNNEK